MMIEKTDRTLQPGEYDDLMEAYILDMRKRMPDPIVCRESIYDGKLMILVEIPLNSELPLPAQITLAPRDAITRLANRSLSRTSLPDED